jgi:predicted transglutaminase-like cysteine proteinase
VKVILLACAALFCCAGPTHADIPVAAPHGAERFCILSPSFCDQRMTVSAPLSKMSTLERINATVNISILPEALDTPLERRTETRDWRVVLPDMLGACVEYATTKEWLLAWEGVPEGAMRLAQVHSPRDSDATTAHMVLLVRINNEVVVLDNLTPVIWPADNAGYDWLAVQDLSDVNPRQWVKPEGPPQ